MVLFQMRHLCMGPNAKRRRRKLSTIWYTPTVKQAIKSREFLNVYQYKPNKKTNSLIYVKTINENYCFIDWGQTHSWICVCFYYYQDTCIICTSCHYFWWYSRILFFLIFANVFCLYAFWCYLENFIVTYLLFLLCVLSLCLFMFVCYIYEVVLYL